MTTQAVLTDELLATIDKHAEVVCKTDDLERGSWLKGRKPFIGASEAAAALGLSPWESQFSLFVDKTTDFVDDEDNQFMKWGRRLEEAIGLGFSEDTGIPVARYPYMMKSRDWPFAAVNVDFLAPNSVVEVKNVGARKSHEWDDGAVPSWYGLQGQHACAVLGLPGVHFAALVGGNDLRPVFVERNDALIEKLMEGERKFWDLVEANTPPEMDGSASTTRAIKSLFVDPEALSEVDLPDEAESLLDRRAIAKSIVKEQTEMISEIENQLFFWMGQHEIGLIDGEVRMTWKKQFRTGYTVAPSSFRKIHVPKIK